MSMNLCSRLELALGVGIFWQTLGTGVLEDSLLGAQTIVVQITLCPLIVSSLPWLNELYCGMTESSFVSV